MASRAAEWSKFQQVAVTVSGPMCVPIIAKLRAANPGRGPKDLRRELDNGLGNWDMIVVFSRLI